jgi:hypothetical protein
MTNTYIQQMKNIATAYYEKVCELRKTIKYNNTTYSRDLADSYNEDTEHQIVSEANNAIEKINAVFEEVKKKISIKNFACTENLGSDSVLKSKILTKPEFDIILKKYLYEYRFVPARQLISEYPTFADGIIPTASDFVETYKKFADSAIRLIYSMMENPRFSKVQLDCYGDKDFASGLYSIIGTGSPLQTVFVNSENEFMAHSFDSVTLEVPSDSFTFNFKGVR